MVFLCPRANTELVSKFHVRCTARFPCSPPYGSIKNFALHQRNFDWPTDRRSQYNLKLNLRHCTANYRPVLSSERAPYMKKIKKEIVTQRNVTSGHPLQKRHGTKTNWPTDRRSQYNFNLCVPRRSSVRPFKCRDCCCGLRKMMRHNLLY
jgi:hypothetical protein